MGLNAVEHPKIMILNQLWLFVTFVFAQRIVFYFPAAWSCFMYVYRSPFGHWYVMVPFTWAVFALAMFNIMVFGIMAGTTVKGTYLLVFGETEKEKDEGLA